MVLIFIPEDAFRFNTCIDSGRIMEQIGCDGDSFSIVQNINYHTYINVTMAIIPAMRTRSVQKHFFYGINFIDDFIEQTQFSNNQIFFFNLIAHLGLIVEYNSQLVNAVTGLIGARQKIFYCKKMPYVSYFDFINAAADQIRKNRFNIEPLKNGRLEKFIKEFVMMESTENAALMSLKEWKAIYDDVRKTIGRLESSMLATDESQTAKPDFTQHLLT